LIPNIYYCANIFNTRNQEYQVLVMSHF